MCSFFQVVVLSVVVYVCCYSMKEQVFLCFKIRFRESGMLTKERPWEKIQSWKLIFEFVDGLTKFCFVLFIDIYEDQFPLILFSIYLDDFVLWEFYYLMVDMLICCSVLSPVCILL